MEKQVRQRYPIGIQTFSEVIEKEYLYIDKTDLIYKMTHGEAKYIFLSRPRRFGKSLLVSTLKAYFEGKKDLFQGLAIEKLEKEWIEYPVLYFDMSEGKHMEKDALERYLANIITTQEELLEMPITEGDANIRLSNLIRRLYMKTGKQVVVLIDEYDAPLLDVVNEKKNLPILRNIMRNFYSPLKGSDQYLKFVFLTGITKFSQSDIFGGLNNIDNISMDEDFASICGITHDEMLCSLRPGIENLAKEKGISYDETVEDLKSTYDGYHFTQDSLDIYNPYSLLRALSDRMISSYWFTTGTPTFLIETLKRFNTNLIYYCNKFVSKDVFDSPVETMRNPVPLLYQAGYITIKDYNKEKDKYLLDFPNKEIREGLLNSLLDEYIISSIDVDNVDRAKEIADLIKTGKIEEGLLTLKDYLTSISYTNQNQNEGHYQQVFGMILSLGGLTIRAEERTSYGRIDITIYLKDIIYVVEIKLDKPASEAIKQIDEKRYARIMAFKNPKQKVYKLGITFSSETRTITDWIIEE